MLKVQILPQRYICAIMLFFVLLSMSMMTNCLPLAITQMVKPIVVNETEVIAMDGDYMVCPVPHITRIENGTLIEAEIVSEPQAHLIYS